MLQRYHSTEKVHELTYILGDHKKSGKHKLLKTLYSYLGTEILRWRHNGRDGVSNHQPHDCLFNRLFRYKSKKASKLRITTLCVGNSSVTVEFLAQMASNVENVSVWWCHRDQRIIRTILGRFKCFVKKELIRKDVIYTWNMKYFYLADYHKRANDMRELLY